MAKQAQAFGIDDATYGAVTHRIAPSETLIVEWANAADVLGVWPPANINVPGALPVTFPAAHPAHVFAELAVIGTDPAGAATVTVELLIDGAVVAGGPQSQYAFSSGTVFFAFTEPSFTSVVGTGPQIRVTNDSVYVDEDNPGFDVLLGDTAVEFGSHMDVYDDFDEPAPGSGRRTHLAWLGVH